MELLMNFTGQHFIASKRSKESELFFRAVNPATGEVMEPSYAEATINEMNQAVESAEKAFEIYQDKKPEEKAHFLETIGREIMELGDELIHRCMSETGLPEARLSGERSRTVNQLNLFADVVREGSWVDARIDTAIPERQLPKPDIRRMYVPLGPVAVFGASNFPLAFSVAGGDTASALAAGCSVVVKAHPAHPGTSEIIGMAIEKAVSLCKMPAGIFSMIFGCTNEVGVNLVQHSGIKAIGFTGSFKGGKALFDIGVSRDEPIPVYAEMGSTNPVFILPDALITHGSQIAEDLSASVTLGVGQFCTNPGVVIIQNSAGLDIFIEELRKKISLTSADTMLTSAIKRNYDEGIACMQSIEGVEIIASGKVEDSGCSGITHLLQTNVKIFIEHTILEEEVFGPSTLLVIAENHDEMLAAAQSLKGHLTVTIHSTQNDQMKYTELFQIVRNKVGRFVMNGYPTGVEVCNSMHHGGPFPATSDSRVSSVGAAAIQRFVRPLCFQDFPQSLLPDPLKDDNPQNIWRLINGKWTQDKI